MCEDVVFIAENIALVKTLIKDEPNGFHNIRITFEKDKNDKRQGQNDR